MNNRSPYFDLAAQQARNLASRVAAAERLDAALDQDLAAYCAGHCDAKGQCQGHPIEPRAEPPSEIVDGARYALESVIRAALAKEVEAIGLAREVARLRNELCRIITGAERASPQTLAQWAADALDG